MSDEMIPNDSGTSCSPWMRETVPGLRSELPRQHDTDVCVIGAGITGLSVAYHLVREGKRVLVIDDGPIGGGETGRTSAHLASALDDRFHELERHHGLRGAAIAAQSHAAAIDDIEAIVERERIDCDFVRVDGYLFVPPGGDSDELTRELAAAHRAGLVDAELIVGAPLLGFQTGPCIRFPRQAQFHPIKYLRALAEAVIGRGGRIATGIRAEKIEGESPVVVTAEGNHVIHAAAVVVATNAPISSPVKIPLKQAAYRSYVVGMAVPAGTVPIALYWDTGDPYHYARIIPGGPGEHDLLIVGGEDHKTGQEDDPELRWVRLVEWTREHFVGATDVVARWSGQIMEPADGLAFIGRDPSAGDHVYIATGDSGNGLTHGTIAGILLTDLILGRDNEWAGVYDPRRSELRRAPGTFLKEAANMAGQYTDWLRAGDVPSADDIPPGAGAVIRRGLHMVAVYRDEAGYCHERTAVCPHLGGIVRWNCAEHSWDCPAHGSRFDCHGRVLNGPANADLAPAGPEAEDSGIPVPAEPVPSPRSAG